MMKMGCIRRTVVGCVLLSGLACQGSDLVFLESPPEELLGSWITSDPEYFDNGFEISEDTVIIHTGEGTFTTHQFYSLSVDSTADGIEYNLRYVGQGEEVYNFPLRYRPFDGTIIFPNQPRMIWKKGSPPPTYLP
jgi:hypothetical protein